VEAACILVFTMCKANLQLQADELLHVVTDSITEKSEPEIAEIAETLWKCEQEQLALDIAKKFLIESKKLSSGNIAKWLARLGQYSEASNLVLNDKKLLFPSTTRSDLVNTFIELKAWEEAFTLACTIDDSVIHQTLLLIGIIEKLLQEPELNMDLIEKVSQKIYEPERGYYLLIKTSLTRGELDRAKEIAATLMDSHWKALAYCEIARTEISFNRQDIAETYLMKALNILLNVSIGEFKGELLVEILTVVRLFSNRDLALTIFSKISGIFETAELTLRDRSYAYSVSSLSLLTEPKIATELLEKVLVYYQKANWATELLIGFPSLCEELAKNDLELEALELLKKSVNFYYQDNEHYLNTM
jgi:hypothetical protein